MPKKECSFTITVELPLYVSVTQMRDYIQEAIQCWCKTLYPGDEEEPGNPLFDLNEKVKIQN